MMIAFPGIAHVEAGWSRRFKGFIGDKSSILLISPYQFSPLNPISWDSCAKSLNGGSKDDSKSDSDDETRPAKSSDYAELNGGTEDESYSDSEDERACNWIHRWHELCGVNERG